MVTGASTSQVAIVLIDARKGVIEQTNRHFFINNLLRIKDIVVTINKMDLVDYSEEGLNKGIKFHNPNAKAVCGCGESFNVA